MQIEILKIILSTFLMLHISGESLGTAAEICIESFTPGSNLLFDEYVQPRVKLIQLLEFVGMEPLNKSENAIVQINNWAQKNLLRKGERWETQTHKFDELKSRIKPLLRDLGFIDEIKPHFRNYQGAIVHGALTPAVVHMRLQYLIEQWKQGITFSHLYFLSGERPIVDHPSITECKMIKSVWEQAEIPDDMLREVEVHFINAPMKQDPLSGQLVRPQTEDTVKLWLREMPPQGRYLNISNQPHILRQDQVLRSIAPAEYNFDGAGPAVSEQLNMVLILDELARFIFQIHIASKR